MKLNAMFRFALILAMLFCTSPRAQAAWIANGVAICTTDATQQAPLVVSDGVGGAIIVWLDYVTGVSDIYAQRVDADGNTLWTTDGVPICTAEGSQYYVSFAPDGASGALIAWQDLRISSDPNIYAQRIDADGNALWTTDGVPVCTLAERQMYPAIIAGGGGGGGAIVAWHDYRSGTADIYAQRIDADGSFLWTADGIPVCSATGAQYYVEAASDGAGGAIITWADYRGVDAPDIYAQRVDPAGTALWTADGVALCTATGSQKWPQIAGDDAGGAIVVWHDYRTDPDADIFAQRVDAGGSVLWTADGVDVCSETGVQFTPALMHDGGGGAIIVWYDERSDVQGDIYAQHLNSAGIELWGAGDLAICTAARTQEAPQITGGGGGGRAIITWGDDRWGSPTNYGDDIYAQKVTADGNILWGADGFAVCIVLGNQMTPAIVSDGTGGAIIAWEDGRSETNLDTYAHRVMSEPIATLLQTYSTALRGSTVEISWSLSAADDDVSFVVLREELGAGAYRDIPGAAIERDGLSFRFMDEGCEAGGSYRYRIDYAVGPKRVELFETRFVTIPAHALRLDQNNPNPFNPSTTIPYTLPESGHVTLEVFDISGRRVACLVNETRPQGMNVVSWNGTDDSGHPVASGIYIYRLAAGKELLSRKMILLK